jgi:hypothetical protein
MAQADNEGDKEMTRQTIDRVKIDTREKELYGWYDDRLRVLSGEYSAAVFEEAANNWLWLGMEVTGRVDRPRRRAEQLGAALELDHNVVLMQIEYKLFHLHAKSVAVLMCEAERNAIDSTMLEVSGRYCRELLKDRHNAKVFHSSEEPIWPDFLGQRLFELPADIRSAIMLGNAALYRLVAISENKDPGVEKRLAEASWARRPDGLNPPNYLKQGAKVISVEPLLYRLLEFMWDRTGPVSEAVVIEQLWGVNNRMTPKNLSTPVSRANSALVECGFQWQIHRKNRFVERDG